MGSHYFDESGGFVPDPISNVDFFSIMSALYGLEAESACEDNKIQEDLRLFLVVEDQETKIKSILH